MARNTNKRSQKLTALLQFDSELLLQHRQQHPTEPVQYVLGVDEVGRGSLVGSVVAAAAIITTPLSPVLEAALMELDDSKATHLNHSKRMALAQTLQQHFAWGLGEASQHEVETLNVAQASLLASYRAIQDLHQRFAIDLHDHLVVLDGRIRLKGFTTPHCAVVKADSQSASVAAASIIAKAYRDNLLCELAQQYPHYGWEHNAGYPTPAHKAALEHHGVSPLHRKTYHAVQQQLQLL